MSYPQCSWDIVFREIDEAAALWEKKNCKSRSTTKSLEDGASVDSVGLPLPDSPASDEDSNQPSTSGEEYVPCPACKTACSVCGTAPGAYCFALPSTSSQPAPIQAEDALMLSPGPSSISRQNSEALTSAAESVDSDTAVSQLEMEGTEFPDETSSGSTIPAYEPPAKKARFRFRVYAECELSPGSLCCWDSHERWSARRVKAVGCPHRALAAKAQSQSQDASYNVFRAPSMTPAVAIPSATPAAAPPPSSSTMVAIGSPPPFRPTPRRRRRWKSHDVADDVAYRVAVADDGGGGGGARLAPILSPTATPTPMKGLCAADSTQSLPESETSAFSPPPGLKSPLASLLNFNQGWVERPPASFSPHTRDSFLSLTRTIGPINIDIEKYITVESMLQSKAVSIPDLLQFSVSPVGQCGSISPDFVDDDEITEHFTFPPVGPITKSENILPIVLAEQLEKKMEQLKTKDTPLANGDSTREEELIDTVHSQSPSVGEPASVNESPSSAATPPRTATSPRVSPRQVVVSPRRVSPRASPREVMVSPRRVAVSPKLSPRRGAVSPKLSPRRVSPRRGAVSPKLSPRRVSPRRGAVSPRVSLGAKRLKPSESPMGSQSASPEENVANGYATQSLLRIDTTVQKKCHVRMSRSRAKRKKKSPSPDAISPAARVSPDTGGIYAESIAEIMSGEVFARENEDTSRDGANSRLSAPSADSPIGVFGMRGDVRIREPLPIGREVFSLEEEEQIFFDEEQVQYGDVLTLGFCSADSVQLAFTPPPTLTESTPPPGTLPVAQAEPRPVVPPEPATLPVPQPGPEPEPTTLPATLPYFTDDMLPPASFEEVAMEVEVLTTDAPSPELNFEAGQDEFVSAVDEVLFEEIVTSDDVVEEIVEEEVTQAEPPTKEGVAAPETDTMVFGSPAPASPVVGREPTPAATTRGPSPAQFRPGTSPEMGTSPELGTTQELPGPSTSTVVPGPSTSLSMQLEVVEPVVKISPARPKHVYDDEEVRMGVKEVLSSLLDGLEYLEITETLFSKMNMHDSEPSTSTACTANTSTLYVYPEPRIKTPIPPRRKAPLVSQAVSFHRDDSHSARLKGHERMDTDARHAQPADSDEEVDILSVEADTKVVEFRKERMKLFNLMLDRCLRNEPRWEDVLKTYPKPTSKVEKPLDPSAEKDVYDYIRVYMAQCAQEFKHSPTERLFALPPRESIVDDRMREVYIRSYEEQCRRETEGQREDRRASEGLVKACQLSPSASVDPWEKQNRANGHLLSRRKEIEDRRREKRLDTERRAAEIALPHLFVEKKAVFDAIPEGIAEIKEDPALDSLRFAHRKDYNPIWMPIDSFKELIKDPIRVSYEDDCPDSCYAERERARRDRLKLLNLGGGLDASAEKDGEPKMQAVTMITKDWHTLRIEYCNGIPRNATIVVDPLTEMMRPAIHTDEHGIRHTTLQGQIRNDTVPAFVNGFAKSSV